MAQRPATMGAPRAVTATATAAAIRMSTARKVRASSRVSNRAREGTSRPGRKGPRFAAPDGSPPPSPERGEEVSGVGAKARGSAWERGGDTGRRMLVVGKTTFSLAIPSERHVNTGKFRHPPLSSRSEHAIEPLPLRRRRGREAEGTALLKRHTSKGYRGFESLRLRHSSLFLVIPACQRSSERVQGCWKSREFSSIYNFSTRVDVRVRPHATPSGAFKDRIKNRIKKRTDHAPSGAAAECFGAEAPRLAGFRSGR